jgi:hypothetical protein
MITNLSAYVDIPSFCYTTHSLISARRETPSMVGASGSSAERKRKRMEELAGKQRAARKKLMRGAAKQQQAAPS